MCNTAKAPTPPAKTPAAPAPSTQSPTEFSSKIKPKSQTILTGAQGLTSKANTAPKTLLGA